MATPKRGLVARADDSGLGTLCWSFFQHLDFEKVLVVYNNNYQPHIERYESVGEDNLIVTKRGKPDLEEVEEFLEGLDLVLTFETPYNWNLFTEAKERNVKTVLVPMYEWLSPNLPAEPDFLACPSLLDLDEVEKSFPQLESEHTPIPIDRERIPLRKREKAKTFLFNNGHGGWMGRNGARELFEAISLVKKDVKFLIHSQVHFKDVINDSRVEIRYGDVPYEELFVEGDIFIFPHKFDGLSLPIQEALCAGLPVISTDIYPHNEYLPAEWLFEPQTSREVYISRKIDVAVLNPEKIAEKIEEWAGEDISGESERANEIAEQFSWRNLKERWDKCLR